MPQPINATSWPLVINEVERRMFQTGEATGSLKRVQAILGPDVFAALKAEADNAAEPAPAARLPLPPLEAIPLPRAAAAKRVHSQTGKNNGNSPKNRSRASGNGDNMKAAADLSSRLPNRSQSPAFPASGVNRASQATDKVPPVVCTLIKPLFPQPNRLPLWLNQIDAKKIPLAEVKDKVDLKNEQLCALVKHILNKTHQLCTVAQRRELVKNGTEAVLAEIATVVSIVAEKEPNPSLMIFSLGRLHDLFQKERYIEEVLTAFLISLGGEKVPSKS